MVFSEESAAMRCWGKQCVRLPLRVEQVTLVPRSPSAGNTGQEAQRFVLFCFLNQVLFARKQVSAAIYRLGFNI